MNKWENTSLDEQETIIQIDYKDKKINIWTNRKIVGNKLKKTISDNPSIVGKEKIYALKWSIPFSERNKIRSSLSINKILMNDYKDNKKGLSI